MTTPLPTLIKDQEQKKLEQIKELLACFKSVLWITKDSAGHIWPFTPCHRCDHASKCRELKLIIERWFNG